MRGYISIGLVVLQALFPAPPVRAESGELSNSAKIVEQHLTKVLSEFDAFKANYGEQVARRVVQDASAESYSCHQGSCRGAREHPWKNGNPNSRLVYDQDSYLIKDYRGSNADNRANLHGCYEFGLLGYSTTADISGFKPNPYGAPEPFECQQYCEWSAAIMPWCWDHALPADIFAIYGIIYPGRNDNASETAMYWMPEYQVSTNNYGINRINPATELDQPLFTREALVSSKKGNDQQKSTQAAATYPYDAGKNRASPDLERDPFMGQGWAGSYAPDYQDKRYAHVHRTKFSVVYSDSKIGTQKGYALDPGKAVLDSFPKKSSEHSKANVWTEYKMWDLFTGIPEFSRKLYPSKGVGENTMTALFGSRRPISSAAKEDPPYWQSRGAMAYRVGKGWTDYQDLASLYGIAGSTDPQLKESVFKGGFELYPMVSNISGFGAPELSFGAIVARRAFYISGENEAMMAHYVDGKARIAQYTIDEEDHSRELDKLQRLRPLKDNTRTSECFRSQNIPNFTGSDQSLVSWADYNLPRSLLKYTMEPEMGGVQGNDASYVYWNRRISCNCKYCGMNTGSYTMNDGDKLYDKRKTALCTYPMGSSFSAWQGMDTLDKCVVPPSQFESYRGLKDKV